MTFRELHLNNFLLNALDELGLSETTPIQEMAFAPIMAGKDVLGIAQTGTGKTFAYLIPLIQQWKFSKKKTAEILVLVPTRELVVQVVDEFEKIAKYTSLKAAGAYGGTNIKTQILAISQGVDVVVATPGRLLDLMLHGTITASHIKKLVIDEVDEMLNLGFRAQLTTLLDLLPMRRQTLMFSATINSDIDLLIENSSNIPVRIEVEISGTPLTNIEQVGYEVQNLNTKINFLEHLLSTDESMTKVLVFAGSKRMADNLNAKLEYAFPDQLAVIHSNKTQNRRLKTVEEFERGACRILIASDLIARGLDVTEITHVINMDVPNVPENYMHRIGRTGRAEKKGKAITMIAPSEKEDQEKIEELMGIKIPMMLMPEEVEISKLLTPDEELTPGMKFIEVKRRKDPEKGDSFHEKKEKNKKVPIKVTHIDKKKLKYGKSYGTTHNRKK